MKRLLMLCACMVALAAFARAAEEKAAPQATDTKGWHEAAAASASGPAKAAPAPEAAQNPPLKAKEADANGRHAGYRGMSLPASGHKIAFLKKGDYVDVLVTFDAQMKDGKEKVTATILQSVLVINIQKPAKIDEIGVIEILLNPNEAQYAALSLYQGEVNFVARAQGDREMHPMEMASFRKLFR